MHTSYFSLVNYSLLIFFTLSVIFQANGQSYSLGEGKLGIKVFNDESTNGSQFGDDHAIMATQWRGKFTWEESTQECNMSIVVPVKDLTADEPEARRWMAMEGEMDESKRASILKNLQGDRQLDMTNYPEITISSDFCTIVNDRLLIKGDFTMHGVTKEVSFAVEDFDAADRLYGYGEFHLSISDYGMQPYSAMFGAIKNQDDMIVVFELDEPKK